MFENLKYNLKHNRKSVVRSVSAWFIFGAIILVFAMFNLQGRNQGMPEGGAAAEINGSTISFAQLSEAEERLRRDPRFEQLQSLGGDAGRQLLQQQALSQLVEMELVRQATDKQRIWTSDAEVRELITSIPQFQEEGRFKRELYRGYLEATRKSPAAFEDEIRAEQALRRTIKIFSAALKPLPLETERQKAMATIKTNLEFVAIPSENLVIPETIPQADIKTFLAEKDSDAKVKDYYESHKKEFSTPERVKVRHILIKAKADDAEAQKAALAKIEGLAKRAEKEDFAKLAGEFSEDPGSKAKGGLIDYFDHGKMVPEFEQAAFALAPNQISKPVKSDFGYHLIQMLDKKPATNRTLDEAREEIAGILIARDRSRVALEELGGLLKKGDQEAVRKFVSDHKLKWDETGPFGVDSETIPSIGPSEEASRIAFSLSDEHPMATSLVRQGTRSLILRHKSVPAGKAEEKKDEKSDLMAEMMAGRRSEDALRLWVEQLKKTARISTNPSIFKR